MRPGTRDLKPVRPFTGKLSAQASDTRMVEGIVCPAGLAMLPPSLLTCTRRPKCPDIMFRVREYHMECWSISYTGSRLAGCTKQIKGVGSWYTSAADTVNQPHQSNTSYHQPIMKFTSTVISFLAVALPVLAQSETLSYDNTYDNPNLSLSTVACSNGPNGLMTKGYSTLGQLPSFPNVGGVYRQQDNFSPCC